MLLPFRSLLFLVVDLFVSMIFAMIAAERSLETCEFRSFGAAGIKASGVISQLAFSLRGLGKL